MMTELEFPLEDNEDVNTIETEPVIPRVEEEKIRYVYKKIKREKRHERKTTWRQFCCTFRIIICWVLVIFLSTVLSIVLVMIAFGTRNTTLLQRNTTTIYY